MKTVGIVVGVLLLITLGTAGTLMLMYQSLHDDAIVSENQIELLTNQSENVLSTTTIKIQDAAGIAQVYTDDLKKVVEGAVSGRYGKEGSRATFQWIQEQNPVAMPETMFLKVQNIIDGGGSEFKISQDRKMEYCKPYQDKLGYLVRGTLLKMAGFPKKDVAKLCQVISDKASREAFDTGVRQPAITR